MFDLIIRNGDVVTPEGVVRCDVAVAGETISAIATPGTLSAEAAKHLIDATGHIVMPGGIRTCTSITCGGTTAADSGRYFLAGMPKIPCFLSPQ